MGTVPPSTDVAASVDADHCFCGWKRPQELDFDGIPDSALPASFEVIYTCPVCDVQWSVEFVKID